MKAAETRVGEESGRSAPYVARCLEPALAYHRRGWNVLAIRPDKKQPWYRWKPLQAERASEDQLRRWYRERSDAGVAVLCMRDLAVLDLDDDQAVHAAHTLLADLRAPTVLGARGCKMLFRHPKHPILGGRIDFRTRTSGPWAGLGVEVLAGPTLAVLPPSQHPSGVPYQWRQGFSLDEYEPPMLPDQVVDLALQAEQPMRAAGPPGRVSSGRNNYLTQFAGRQWRNGVSEADLLRTLVEENRRVCDLSPAGSEGATSSGITGYQVATRWREGGLRRAATTGA